MQIPLSKQPPIQKKLKKFQVQHICHSAWSREAESQSPLLQVCKVLDSATSGINALRAE